MFRTSFTAFSVVLVDPSLLGTTGMHMQRILFFVKKCLINGLDTKGFVNTQVQDHGIAGSIDARYDLRKSLGQSKLKSDLTLSPSFWSVRVL
jgi:hypothetical protein